MTACCGWFAAAVAASTRRAVLNVASDACAPLAQRRGERELNWSSPERDDVPLAGKAYGTRRFEPGRVCVPARKGGEPGDAVIGDAGSEPSVNESKIDAGAIGGGPRAFHLLAKPTGAVCNLDCAYCFFLSKEMLYPGSRFRMADELLETYLRQLIEAHAGVPEVTVAWQGGEPTMMGIEFFRRSVRLAQQYLRPGQRAAHTIQTNGTLVDAEWAAFFRENDFLVGLSIDGPREMHDAYRVNKGGKGSFDRVMRGLGHLRDAGVEWNALTTIHAANGDHGRAVYRFLRDGCGARYIQFIPIIERVAESHRGRKRTLDVLARPAAIRAARRPRHRPLGHRRAVWPVSDRRLRGVGAPRRRRGVRADVRRRARQLVR